MLMSRGLQGSTKGSSEWGQLGSAGVRTWRQVRSRRPRGRGSGNRNAGPGPGPPPSEFYPPFFWSAKMRPQLIPLAPTRPLPELTEGMRLALIAIELAAGRPLCEVKFARPDGEVGYKARSVELRKLLRKGLIAVVSLSPAVYRITKLGRIAREFRR